MAGYTEECRECSGTGKCKHCDGVGEVEHVCRPSTLTIIGEYNYPGAPERTTYYVCSICGTYWKGWYQPDPGAGNSSGWLELGQKYNYRSFTQKDLDEVLEKQAR